MRAVLAVDEIRHPLIDSMPPATTISRLAELNRLRAERDRLQSRGAGLVDGLRRHRVAQPGPAAPLAARDSVLNQPAARGRRSSSSHCDLAPHPPRCMRGTTPPARSSAGVCCESAADSGLWACARSRG
jgi:hypothetical protein